MRAVLTAMLIVLAAAPVAAQGRGQVSDPSFDCRRARTPVERMICGRPELGALDRRLSDLFRSATLSSDDAAAHRVWLSRRDGCVRGASLDGVAACIAAAYRERIATLEYGAGSSRMSLAALEPPPSGPSFDCRRAAEPIESVICADAALSALDVELSRRYLARGAGDPLLAAAQQRWLAERDSCLRDPMMMTMCVAAAYTRRIAELR